MRPKRNRASPDKPANGGCLVLFALPFAAVGVGMGVWLFATIGKVREARAWEEVPARILSTRLVENRGDDSTTYQTEAQYRYRYGDQVYESDRVTFHVGSDNLGSFQENAHRALEQHLDPVGESELEDAGLGSKPFRCYVNPQDPSESVLFRHMRLEMVLLQSLMMFLFGGAGFGLMWAGVVNVRTQSAQKTFVARNPDKAWRARPEWSGTVIPADRRQGVAIAVFSVIWNLMAFPITLFALPELLRSGLNPGWLVLLFPLVGIGLLIVGVRAVILTRKYGLSRLTLSTMPGVPGGRLAGVVELSSKVRAEGGFRLRLVCARTQTTGSGKNRRTVEHVLWEEEQRLMVDGSRDPSRSALPFIFSLPRDVEPSDPDAPEPVRWHIEVRARNPGVDLYVRFHVPVLLQATG